MLSFYGTLPGNYIIEAEYEGAISGISLAPREEIIEAVLDTATARSFENNTNCPVFWAKLRLDIHAVSHCAASGDR